MARDDKLAFEVNAEAAELGDRDAVLAMGWFYSLGAMAFEQQDYPEALLWLRRAADAGHTRSLFWLGKLHWRGRGVPADRKAAMKLFKKP